MRRTLLSVLLLACALFAASPAKEPAPNFNAKTLDGERFNNASLKGKVVLLQFWATWCQYCRGDQPFVDEINQQFSPKGLVILAIDVNESKKTVKKYLAEKPRAVRIVLTDDTNLPAMFEAKGFPLYILIDRDGNIAGIQRGAAGKDALLDLIARAGLSDDDSPPTPANNPAP